MSGILKLHCSTTVRSLVVSPQVINSGMVFGGVLLLVQDRT
ncbi:MAG: hypothetical protein ACXWNK_18175 [Vulcanimicrobiaceae bacterium]